MGALRKLARNLYLVTGSPSTMIRRIGEEEAVIVDPGRGPERCGVLREALKKLSLRPVAVLLTHSHPDHIEAAACMDARIYTHRVESCIASSDELRGIIVYGARRPDKIYSIRSGNICVDEYIEWGDEIYGLEAVGLPGHSPGHTGFADHEARILYAGDSVFGERLLQRVALPFASDHSLFLESLDLLEDYVRRGYRIVASHGPVARGESALRMIREARERLRRAEEIILGLSASRGISIPEAAYRVTVELGAEPSPELLLLNEVTVRSIISVLVDRGLLEPLVSERGIIFRGVGVEPP